MTSQHPLRSLFSPPALLTVAGLVLSPPAAPRAVAQNPELQERLNEVKQSAAHNKQALAQYSWQEQQTTSIKGDVKKQELFQVRLGPDGKPQKTELEQMPQSSGGRQHGLKHHVIEKKKGEDPENGQQIAALAQPYPQPTPHRPHQTSTQATTTALSA